MELLYFTYKLQFARQNALDIRGNMLIAQDG